MADPTPILLSTAAPATLVRTAPGLFTSSDLPWLFAQTTQIIYVEITYADATKMRLGNTQCKVTPVAASASPLVAFDPMFDAVTAVVEICVVPLVATL
jgi:hypothetical protein